MALFSKIEIDISPTIIAEAVTVFGDETINGDMSLVKTDKLVIPLTPDDYPAITRTTIELVPGLSRSITKINRPLLDATITCKDSRFYPYWIVAKVAQAAIAIPSRYALVTMRDYCHVDIDDYGAGYSTRLVRLDNPQHKGLLNGQLPNGWSFRWIADN